jgi:hypothetical protein
MQGNATNEKGHGYAYFYNLHDSSKQSLVTMQTTTISTIGSIYMYYGGQVYNVAETINAVRILNNSGGNFTAGSVSLYGVEQ